MSDTPRTDNEWFWANRMGDDELVVQASFARQLEREFNQQLKINQQLAMRLNAYERGHVVGGGTTPFK